ncbi:MAG: phosphopyruvate hydratase, partial [bacterium]
MGNSLGAIARVNGRQILNGMGNPAVEVSVTLDNGARGVASVAAGASTGTFEAHALFDGNGDIYHGMGVTKAVD